MAKKTSLFIVGVLLLVLTVQVAAETNSDPLELDIATSINLALIHNKDFQRAALDIESKEIAYTNKAGTFIPSISASSGLQYTDRAISGITNDTISSSENPLNFSAGLTFSLSLNRKLKYDIREIDLAYENEQINYDTVRRQLIREVEKEFYTLVTLHSNLAILQRNQDLAEKRFTATQMNYENGFATSLEVNCALLSTHIFQQFKVYHAACSARSTIWND